MYITKQILILSIILFTSIERIDANKYDEEGNIELNHTRRLLRIDGDKYDEEGNIELNHTRRLLRIDGDKYDEEGNIELNHTRRLLRIDGDKYDEEGNIELNHTRRLLSIDADKYDEEGNIDLNHTRRLLRIDGDKYDEEGNIELNHTRRLLRIDGDKYDEEGNIELNHTRRLLSIDADKYDEEGNIDLNHRRRLLNKSSVIKSRQKRTAEKYTGENITDTEETTKDNMTEECVGQKEFCNLSREEYVSMLNDYIYPHTYEWILIGTHTLVFITGLVGNALVCVAVYRNHSMRTVTNYFIVNLAVADFMVILFCLPATVLWDVTETWFLGDVLCKMLLYFQSVSVTVSVLTLTFISVDRWYAICFPLKFKSTTGRAKTAILVIWALALTFNAPELVVLTTEKSVPLRFELEYLVQCVATWSSNSDLVWHIIKVIFIYTLPLLLMTVAYYQIVKVLWRSEKIPGQAETIKLAPAEQTQLRSRRKAAKMLVAVVIMFAVCYFPVHLLSVLRYTLDMEQNDVITCLALISHVMCYANSAINPVIYNFMSGKFRREFRRAFCCSTASDLENMTTLSRFTTSKKRPCDLMTFETKAQGRNVCSTTFVHNGYKNKYILT